MLSHVTRVRLCVLQAYVDPDAVPGFHATNVRRSSLKTFIEDLEVQRRLSSTLQLYMTILQYDKRTFKKIATKRLRCCFTNSEDLIHGHHRLFQHPQGCTGASTVAAHLTDTTGRSVWALVVH